MIPGEPQLESPKASDGSEPKTYKIFPALSLIRGMAVSYADHPSGGRGGDPESILNKLRDGAITNLKGQLVSETRITLKGVPGRELKVSLPKNYLVRMRLYLAGSRQYSLMIVVLANNYDTPEVRKFFGSFEITP